MERILERVAGWLVLLAVTAVAAVEAGPFVGRWWAAATPESQGAAVVAIAVLLIGSRWLRRTLSSRVAMQSVAGMATGAGATRGVAKTAGAPDAVAHESAHAVVLAVLGVGIEDVTPARVRLDAEWRARTTSEPIAVWHRMVGTMAGRLGQLSVGDETLASLSDYETAYMAAWNLYRHRAALPVEYSGPEDLVEHARAEAAQVLEKHRDEFDLVRDALTRRGRLAGHELLDLLSTTTDELAQAAARIPQFSADKEQ